MQRFHKTRIAPTPSGYLHLGNILSFSVTAALARRTGASILLRIDDLDRDRVSREYVEDIFETLRFLEIPWDEGPKDFSEYERSWSQVCRLEIYGDALRQLRSAGKLFACDCSRSQVLRTFADGGYPGTCRSKELPLDRAGCNWRVRTGGAGVPDSMADFVVRKKDGYPAYQLTSVADDLYFGVDLVVRGEDLRASTAAQQWLARELGKKEFELIRFVHHPLLVNDDNAKISKSNGAESVQYFRRNGAAAADFFSGLGQRAGLTVPVGTWQALGDGLIGHWQLG